jgi:DNA-directed RNA polymerase beta subunit
VSCVFSCAASIDDLQNRKIKPGELIQNQLAIGLSRLENQLLNNKQIPYKKNNVK